MAASQCASVGGRDASCGFAKGRASQRQDDFRRALERHLLEREEEAREWGGSYLAGLLGQLPPLSPPKRENPRKAVKRGKANARSSARSDRWAVSQT